MANENKIYLGDSAYAEITGYGEIFLTTENGISVQNRVVMDFKMLGVLNSFVESWQRIGDGS